MIGLTFTCSEWKFVNMKLWVLYWSHDEYCKGVVDLSSDMCTEEHQIYYPKFEGYKSCFVFQSDELTIKNLVPCYSKSSKYFSSLQTYRLHSITLFSINLTFLLTILTFDNVIVISCWLSHKLFVLIFFVVFDCHKSFIILKFLWSSKYVLDVGLFVVHVKWQIVLLDSCHEVGSARVSLNIMEDWTPKPNRYPFLTIFLTLL